MTTTATEERALPAVADNRALTLNLAPVIDPATAVARLEEFTTFVKSTMTEGVDYGTIQGTQKPCLLKPGAEKLSAFYGLAPRLELTLRVENWDKDPPLFDYEYKCVLVSKRDETFMGEGVGSCNSYETKYRYRIGKMTCPDCIQDRNKEVELNRSKQEPAWYCWAKLGGCGRNFFDGPKGEVSDELKKQFQNLGRVPNKDMADSKNTILKMAKKRALVDAILTATAASSMFTQDLDDLKGDLKDAITVTVEDVTEAKAADAEGRKAPPPPKPTSKPPSRPGTSATAPKPADMNTTPAHTPAKDAVASPTPKPAAPPKPASNVTDINSKELAGFAGLKGILDVAQKRGWVKVVNGQQDRKEATNKLFELFPVLKGGDILKILTVAQAEEAKLWFDANPIQ